VEDRCFTRRWLCGDVAVEVWCQFWDDNVARSVVSALGGTTPLFGIGGGMVKQTPFGRKQRCWSLMGSVIQIYRLSGL